MAKKTSRDRTAPEKRRETLEAMRREQRRRERRKNMLVVGGAGVLGLALIGAVAVPMYLDYRSSPRNRTVSSYGVSASDAQCQKPVSQPATGVQDHVQEGTTVTYKETPPAFGQHYDMPASFQRGFYTPEDAPRPEVLVHNLEHGYTLLWYASDLSADEREPLADLAASARDDLGTYISGATKFIVAPWPVERGAMPEGARFVLAHWGAKEGTRQACGRLSGEVVEAFVKAHPYSDSPEPEAA